MINKIIKSDIVERLLKTFIQAFFGVIITASFTDITNLTTLKVLIIAGISAGLSAVWNSIKTIKNK